jgi:hypothetical protein
MSDMISMPVNDIPEPDRRSLENLLGHPLAADQQVCVMVFSAGKVSDEATRLAAAEGIRRTLEDVDRHQVSRGITDDEIDAAINEALLQIPPRQS